MTKDHHFRGPNQGAMTKQSLPWRVWHAQMFGNRKASRWVAEALKPVANLAGFTWFWAKQAVGNLSAIPVTKVVPRMAHLGNTQALRVGTAHCRRKFKSASALSCGKLNSSGEKWWTRFKSGLLGPSGSQGSLGITGPRPYGPDSWPRAVRSDPG